MLELHYIKALYFCLAGENSEVSQFYKTKFEIDWKNVDLDAEKASTLNVSEP